jgi:hypothetical protein
MATFLKYILPAILAFLAVLIGVYLTSFFNHTDWQKKADYETRVKILEQRLQLIERTTTVTGKMPSTNGLFNVYFSNIIDTSKQNRLSASEEIVLTEKLGEVRAELRSVMFLNQLYFGDSTKAKIHKYLIKEKSKTWWDLPDETYNDIVETMAKELTLNLVPSDNSQATSYPMSDTLKIIWTALATLIGGIIIYVIGRTIEKFVLEPIQEYRKTLANISDTFIFYANVYSNTSVSSLEDKTATSKAIRKLASDLAAKTHQITFYKFFFKLKVIPSYNNSMDAVSTLIGFSNSMWHSTFDEIDARRQRIETLLKIRTQ